MERSEKSVRTIVPSPHVFSRFSKRYFRKNKKQKQKYPILVFFDFSKIHLFRKSWIRNYEIFGYSSILALVRSQSPPATLSSPSNATHYPETNENTQK